MGALSDGNRELSADTLELSQLGCRDLLRAATQAPHERLHLHAGFSMVKDGTITLPDYRALMICLYGFYRPFERALGGEPIRSEWLESDLAWLGVDAASSPGLSFCTDIPRYDSRAHRLGALYVVEGSALGGRQLCRGLDGLFGAASLEGRRFFAGRGAETGGAWLGLLEELASFPADPMNIKALVGAAVETFEVFETWLGNWDKTK